MPYDDMIPEENEEQYRQLIPLLRRGFRKSVTISPSESSQIIDQVRERLQQANSLPSQEEETPGQITSIPVTSVYRRRKGIPRLLTMLVAVLVVGILISTSLTLVKYQSQSSLHSIVPIPATVSAGPTARTQANGLEATMHIVTPGPYFLSELLLVDVSLTNHTKASFNLDGRNQAATLCFASAITVQMTSKDVPSYALPPFSYGCNQPAFTTVVTPGHTLALRQYLPVTNSGEVTITMEATTAGFHPLDQLTGHWPSLRVHVDPRVPSDHMISLHSKGTQVMIQAPQAARSHLLYMQSISCENYMASGDSWTPLATTVLSRPPCPTAFKFWEYIVSAPGYPIISGKQSS